MEGDGDSREGFDPEESLGSAKRLDFQKGACFGPSSEIAIPIVRARNLGSLSLDAFRPSLCCFRAREAKHT